MRTPYPFEPAWEVDRGNGVERGKGTLPMPWENVNHFRVLLGDSSVSVFPKAGYIALDNTIKLAALPQAKLIWFRRMQALISTHDTNATLAPECLFYGIGLESEGKRVGYRLYADGRLLQGGI